nr:translocation/assembly module TamB domain-containing protein [uncultured Cohaesibacter sp.]
MKSAYSSIFRGLYILLFVLLALLLVGYLLLSTSFGLSMTANLVNSIASSDEQKVEISGLDSLLGDITIKRVSLSDKNGTWLEAKGLSGHYSLLALFSLDLSIDSVGLEELNVSRLPAASDTPAEDTSSDGSLIPSLPAVSAEVGELSIRRISLGETVLGKAAELTLSSNMALDGAPFRTSGSLDLHYLDAPTDGLTSSWDLAPSENRRLLSLAFTEPRGGLAARLIDMADLPAIDISLKGDGAADNWRSDLSVKLDGQETVSGQVLVSLADASSRINAKLQGKLSPFLPSSVIPLVAGTSTIDLAVEQSKDDVLQLKQLSFVSGLAHLEASGFLNNRDNSLDVAMRFNLGQEGTQIELQQTDAPSLNIGHVGLEGRLSGSLDKAALKLEGSLASLAQNSLAVDGVSLSMSAPELNLQTPAGLINTKITVNSIASGSDQLDAILDGTKALDISSQLSGQEIELKDLTLNAGLLSVKSQGRYAPDALAFKGNIALADLKPINDGLSGALKGSFAVDGTASDPHITLAMSNQKFSVYNKSISELTLDLASTAAPDARLTLAALYDGSPLKSAVELKTNEDGSRSINKLEVSAPGTSINGALSVASDGLATGSITASVSDFSELGPLLLQPGLKGSLKADISLSSANGKQAVDLQATVPQLAMDAMSLSAMKLASQINDVTGSMSMNSSLTVDRITASGETIRSLKANMTGHDGNLPFSLDASLSQAPLKLSGTFLQQDNRTALALDTFSGRWKSIALSLVEPVKIDLSNGVKLGNTLTLAVDSGTVAVSGSAGDQLDLAIALNKIPLSIAEKVTPTGETPTGQIDLTAQVSGSSSNPVATWKGSLSGLSVRSTRQAGLPQLAINSSGRFDNNIITMQNHLTGGGADLAVSGNVGLTRQSLNIAAKGSVPFSLAARSLADAGLQLDGSANVAANVTGSFTAPDIKGSITTKGARFSEFSSGIVLRDLAGTVTLEGQRAVIQSVTGRLGKEGTLDIKGTVGIDANAGLPADISVTIRNGNFKYEDMLTSLFNASMSLKGQLTGDSVISGQVALKTTEIMIPEKLPQSLTPIDVTHKNATGRVAEQAKKFAPKESSSASTGPAMRLDLQIKAPRSIYVRGRGMDAELGGTIRITGTTADPRPLGSIDMQRGRLEILTKRLDFDSGTVTFAGTLDPALDFTANASSSGTTYTVTVGGYASAPEIELSSSPTLPEDEILAHLFFDKNLADLSAIQLAQLANAVATLSGVNSGPGVLDRLRNMAGIDNIDIKSDETTNETTVGVGRYINDRTYINVEKSTASDSGKVSIDLDITDQFKAHGEASSDGEAKAGIFFERDY